VIRLQNAIRVAIHALRASTLAKAQLVHLNPGRKPTAKGKPLTPIPKTQGGVGQMECVSVTKMVFKMCIQPLTPNYATKNFLAP